MEPLMEPVSSHGLVAFELPSVEGQPSVKCISLVNIIIAIKKVESQAKGKATTDDKLRIWATQLLRDQKKKPDCKLSLLKTSGKSSKQWHPVATSEPEYVYLLSLMKLNDKTIHDFLKVIGGLLPAVSPIPEIAAIFPTAASSTSEPSDCGCEEPAITIEILKECGFSDPRAINQLDQKFTAQCRSVEEAMGAIGQLLFSLE